MYYLLLPDLEQRTQLIDELKASGINTVFHYIPLHNSPAGQRYTRTDSTLTNTEQLSERLLRLPLWVGLEEQQDSVIDTITKALR